MDYGRGYYTFFIIACCISCSQTPDIMTAGGSFGRNEFHKAYLYDNIWIDGRLLYYAVHE